MYAVSTRAKAFLFNSIKQVVHATIVRVIDVATQMLVGQFCDFASSRGALEETLLDEERLIYLLHCTSLFAHRCGDGVDTHRSTLELVDDGGENLVVDFVKTILVDIECFERYLSDLGVNTAVTLHLCEIANTTKECIRNTRCTTTAACYLVG